MSKSFTDDGSIMAYSLSSGGSDWRTIHFLTIAEDGAATELPDKLENVKFSSMAWTHDGKVICVLILNSIAQMFYAVRLQVPPAHACFLIQA